MGVIICIVSCCVSPHMIVVFCVVLHTIHLCFCASLLVCLLCILSWCGFFFIGACFCALVFFLCIVYWCGCVRRFRLVLCMNIGYICVWSWHVFYVWLLVYLLCIVVGVVFMHVSWVCFFCWTCFLFVGVMLHTVFFIFVQNVWCCILHNYCGGFVNVCVGVIICACMCIFFVHIIVHGCMLMCIVVVVFMCIIFLLKNKCVVVNMFVRCDSCCMLF